MVCHSLDDKENEAEAEGDGEPGNCSIGSLDHGRSTLDRPLEEGQDDESGGSAYYSVPPRRTVTRLVNELEGDSSFGTDSGAPDG